MTGRLLIFCVAFAAITSACSSPSATDPVAEAPGYDPWDQDGVSLQHPKGWNVEIDDENGTVSIEGTGGEQLYIRPFFTSVSLTDKSAGAALEEVAPSLIGAQWGAAEGSEPAIRMSGTIDDHDALAAIAWINSDEGSAGHIYAASSPNYEVSQEMFVRILESFRLTGSTQAPAGPEYQTFSDPTEGAFTAELPSGWDVEGAVVRPCPTLVQGFVHASSPDRNAYIKLGSDYPWFTEPAPSLFLPEGSTYPHPCGYSSPVLRYLPGDSFVTEWLLPQTLPEASIVRAESRPDLAGQLTSFGLNSYDAGEVEYTWNDNGELRRGLIVVITERFSFGGSGAWAVWRLAQAEASEAAWSQTLAAGEHLVATFRIDPGWAQSQAQLTAAQSRIIADMGEAVSRTISDGYWGRQATYDAIFEARSDATLEVEDFADPVTGETYTLDSGPEYYWIDPAGNVIGTDTSAKPDIDFRELIRID